MRKPNPYAERNRLVEKIGFKNYPAYLKSELWADIRARVLDRDLWKCVMWHSDDMCDNPATEVHHRRYDLGTLLGIELSGLVAVCRGCHQRAECGRNGKRTLAQANNHLGVGKRMTCWLCSEKFPDTVMMPRGNEGRQTGCPECDSEWHLFHRDRARK